MSVLLAALPQPDVTTAPPAPSPTPGKDSKAALMDGLSSLLMLSWLSWLEVDKGLISSAGSGGVPISAEP